MGGSGGRGGGGEGGRGRGEGCRKHTKSTPIVLMNTSENASSAYRIKSELCDRYYTLKEIIKNNIK